MRIRDHKLLFTVGIFVLIVGLIALGCSVSPATEVLPDTSDKNIELTEVESPNHEETEATLRSIDDDHTEADDHAEAVAVVHDDADTHDDEDEDIIEVTLNVVEGRNWGFDPPLVEIPVGHAVMLTLVNDGRAEHDVEIAELMADHIEVMGGAGDSHMHDDVIAAHAMPGHTAAVMFTPMETGEFEFTCTLPGHKEAGMVGRLVVTN